MPRTAKISTKSKQIKKIVKEIASTVVSSLKNKTITVDDYNKFMNDLNICQGVMVTVVDTLTKNHHRIQQAGSSDSGIDDVLRELADLCVSAEAVTRRYHQNDDDSTDDSSDMDVD